MKINPSNDGIDHINIYSKGKTELGRLLSNFAHTPFEYEPYGTFQSVEGFWYYYFTGCKYEILKTLHGYEAKKQGQLLGDEKKKLTNEDKLVVMVALMKKLCQNPEILQKLYQSNLPLKHYYSYPNGKITELPQYDWIVNFFENVRLDGKNNLENEITKIQI